MRHAAADAGSPKAAAASGRCDTASTRARSGSTSCAKIAGNFAMSTETSVPGSVEPSTGNGVQQRAAARSESGNRPCSSPRLSPSSKAYPAR